MSACKRASCSLRELATVVRSIAEALREPRAEIDEAALAAALRESNERAELATVLHI